MAGNWLASHGPVYPSNLGMRVDDVVPAFSDDNLSQISVLVNLVLKDSGPRLSLLKEGSLSICWGL